MAKITSDQSEAKNNEGPPAPHTARVVEERIWELLVRQHARLESLDLKTSFLVSTASLILTGGLGALATRPPKNPHVFDLGMTAAGVLFVSILAGLYVWWPRSIESINANGLYQHFNDDELNMRKAVSGHTKTAWEKNYDLHDKKILGFQIASIMFGLALFVGTITVVLSMS